MNDYNITIAYGDGTYSHTQNMKADSKKHVLLKLASDYFYSEKSDEIISITILKKKPYGEKHE